MTTQPNARKTTLVQRSVSPIRTPKERRHSLRRGRPVTRETTDTVQTLIDPAQRKSLRRSLTARLSASKDAQKSSISSGPGAIVKKRPARVLPVIDKQCRTERSVQIVNRHFARFYGIHVELLACNNAQRIKTAHWKSGSERNPAPHEFKPKVLQTERAKAQKRHVSRDTECEARIQHGARDTLTVKKMGWVTGAGKTFVLINLHRAQNDEMVSHSSVLRPVEYETYDTNTRRHRDSFHICLFSEGSMKECGTRAKTRVPLKLCCGGHA